MLVKRIYIKKGKHLPVRWVGWYLFGFIPLLIMQVSLDEKD